MDSSKVSRKTQSTYCKCCTVLVIPQVVWNSLSWKAKGEISPAHSPAKKMTVVSNNSLSWAPIQFFKCSDVICFSKSRSCSLFPVYVQVKFSWGMRALYVLFKMCVCVWEWVTLCYLKCVLPPRSTWGTTPPKASHAFDMPHLYEGLLFMFNKACILCSGNFYSEQFKYF